MHEGHARSVLPPSTDTGCFCVVAVGSDATLNTDTQASLQHPDLSSSGSSPGSGIAASCSSSVFRRLRGRGTVFHFAPFPCVLPERALSFPGKIRTSFSVSGVAQCGLTPEVLCVFHTRGKGWFCLGENVPGPSESAVS